MDATNACCPHTPCDARGQIGQGHLGSHSRKAQRCIGHAWPHTFRAPTGPVFDRLRTTGAPVVLVVPWLAYGGPVQAMGAAWGGGRADARRLVGSLGAPGAGRAGVLGRTTP